MNSLSTFMQEMYVIKPDSKLTVKAIYQDFRNWIIDKYGISVWNNINQRDIYAALKILPDYAYVRYKEGYCLKGIAYKSVPENIPSSENIQSQYLELNIMHNPTSNDVKSQLSSITIELEDIKNKQIIPKVPRVIIPTIGVKRQ